jgi:hypothetical protein
MADPIITIDTQPESVFALVGESATFVVAAHQDQAATLNYQWYQNNVAIAGATSDTYTFTVTTDSGGLYSVLITCSIGVNTATSKPAALASSILDNIELQITIAILSMTVSGGYNYDWKTANELQLAYGGYPRFVILSPKETNLDDPNGPNAQAYTNSVLFVIDAMCEQVATTQNPVFTIRSNLRLALDDIKKLFGYECSKDGNCFNNSCFEVLYRSADIIATERNNIQVPAFIRIQAVAKYMQDRLIPTQTAGS